MSVRPPTRLKVFSSRKRRSLACRPRRHLADLVEEHGAAVGGLEEAALLLPGVGERAPLVAEELAFEQLLRQCRRGDVDERPGRPRAVVVNGLGREVLPGSGLAAQEQRRGGAGRDLAQQFLHAGHRRRRPDDGVEAVVAPLAAAERHHLAAQRQRFERLLSQHHDVVEIERLVDVVEGAELHRLDGVLDGRERRHQDDRHVGAALLHAPQDRQSVAVGQLEVEKDEIDVVARAVRPPRPRSPPR